MVELFVLIGIFSLVITLMGMILLSLRKKLNLTIFQLREKQTKANQMGINTAMGNLHEILAKFAFLTEYDELLILSTTSRQASLDLIGIKHEECLLHFIEIKKKGARVTTSENKIRRIIETGKIEYVVKDIELPDGVSIETRKLRPLPNKKIEKELINQ